MQSPLSNGVNTSPIGTFGLVLSARFSGELETKDPYSPLVSRHGQTYL